MHSAVLKSNIILVAFYGGKKCFGETDMNQYGSHQNHENRSFYDRLPPQYLSEVWWQGVFLKYCVEKHVFVIKDKKSIDGGDSTCLPRPPLRCAIMLYYLHRSNRIMGDASAVGVKVNICRSPKER
jgi:hypothetical protein